MRRGLNAEDAEVAEARFVLCAFCDLTGEKMEV